MLHPCCSNSAVVVLVHLAAFFPARCSLPELDRASAYTMIVALVGKALLHYDGVEYDWKPTVADAATKTCNSACNSTCSLCHDQSCCKLGIHKGHVCSGCANRPRQCILDCMGENCFMLCDRPGLREHTWHFCNAHEYIFGCTEACQYCKRNYSCIRRKPGHRNHSCSLCEGMR